MFRKNNLARRLLLFVLPLALCGVRAGAAPSSAAARQPGSAPSVLLFPLDNNAGASADGIAGRVSDALQLRLSSVGAYKVTVFSPFLPPVQRATSETPPVLSADDVKSPFDSQKAGRIAAQVATDDYLVGAVETYTADPATRRVSVTVSADLRSTLTGNSLRTVAYTSTAAPVSNSEPLDSVSQRAIDSVAGKITSAVDAGQAPRSVVLNSSRGKSTAGQTFLLAVLASSLIYAVLHNSNGDSHTSGTSISTGGASGGTGGTTGVPGVPAPPTNP